MQQINLYQDEFFPRYNYQMIGITGAFVLLLLIFIVVNIYQIYYTNVNRAELERKANILKDMERAYAVLEISTKPKAKDMQLVEDLERIKSYNAEKRRALSYLSGNDAGNVSGFSFLLQGLGKKRDSINDLWLKKIKFSRGGYHMYLSGSSYQPELLPKFIQALSSEEIYKDREFKKISITRSKDNKKMMDFVLSTIDESKGSENTAIDTPLSLFIARLKQLSSEKERLE